MSETLETILALRSRDTALAQEQALASAARQECEAKGREYAARYFEIKKERELIAGNLRTAQASHMEEQALSAAQKAQQDAEKARAEANAAVEAVKADRIQQQQEHEAKMAELRAEIEKLKKPTE